MFWGLIMEPNKRYTQVVEKPFHISQAAMDISTGDTDPCQVMVMVEGKNFLICTLQKKNSIQVPLDLYFKAGDSISFLTNGKANVHLTGYLDPEFEDEEDDEDDEEDEEEDVPALVAPGKNKRKVETNGEAVPSKKAKHDKKSKKQKEEEEDSSDEEDDDNHLQKLLDGDLDSDENDDSFKANTSADDSDEEEDDDDDEVEDDDDDGDEEEVEADDDDGESAVDTSKEEPELDTSKLSKSQRKRLHKKKKLEEAKAAAAAKSPQPQVNGVAKKQEKKEKKKEIKKEEASAEKKEKKALSGGVQIEDVKVGNGPVAKPGKTVMVYYEGRLKANNKKFDDCQKGPGFKFRLGAKEVITGWDVGVAGMKAGGKRRIVCPPAMAYGAKGSPPVIPPNSTLVFEVELKEVK